MILTLRKKNLDARKNILRDVFEGNRLMLNGRRPGVSLGRPFPRKRILLSLMIAPVAVFLHAKDVNTSFSPSIIHPLTLPNPGAFHERPVNTSEMSALEKVEKTGNFPLSRMLGLRIKTIMIDPGHGGAESGCIGEMGTKEKDITLDIAKRVKAYLAENNRYHVLMTREDDRSVPLGTRVALAREARADVFISIHVNSLPSKEINIVETYYFGPSTDQKILQLAGRENAGSEYGLSDFKGLMQKLGTTMKLQESRELSRCIQANVFQSRKAQSEDIQDHGVKRAPFVVLLGPDVPSVLVEVSCLSNLEEERKLNSEDHKENIARSLAGGIFDYLSKGATYEAKR